VGESWVLENVSLTPHGLDDVLKRSFDVLGALCLGLIALPLYPIIMLAIKLEDRGAIFYRTERIGRYNKPIHMLKFRTMNGHDHGTAALQSELRVTRVGRFLRKTRLDEIPQFWNIFRGDLSFIGPRPEMPALAAVYAERIPFYNLRHMITPGLSGWAQINEYEVPRSGIDVDRTITKLSFDLYYLKHRSFLLDLEIALKTLKTLLLRSGT
jgi:lipopolysaccharide/colanic/teichoic acid biosynthesis glycosyltransferase